jgi:hypothetical protein
LDKISCKHESIQTYALATFIHELVHVIDKEKKWSLDKNFIDIVGGRRKYFGSKRSIVMNQNDSVSPDNYEFVNLAESLAVNSEYFILDPEFKCRRPALARYLSNLYKWSHPENCKATNKIILHSNTMEENLTLVTELNPKKVYQIHYLWAGEGKAMMSRWGHSMFRIITCAPWKKKVGPDCLNDLLYHIVISYRAHFHSMDATISQGLTGKLPSQMFVYRLSDIMQEYNTMEFRDLFSVPLKMSEEEKEEFLTLAIERYWTYKSKYKFFTNNCGTEALRHFRGVKESESKSELSSFSPRKLYRDLLNRPEFVEIDIRKLLEQEAKNKTYKISSNYPYFEGLFRILKENNLTQYKKFDDFVAKSKVQDRREAYESFMEGNKNILILNTMIAMEIYLRDRALQAIPDILSKKVKGDSRVKDYIKNKEENFQVLFNSPWDLFDTRYGIPSEAEFEDQLRLVLERGKLNGHALSMSIIQLLDDYKNKYLKNELEEISEMMNLIQKIKETRGDAFFIINK